MIVTIRKEEKADFNATFNVVQQAFASETMSDHQEQFLVARLRNSDAFVPELSLVAEVAGRVVGYVLLTKVKIVHEAAGETTVLALAPVAVLPAYQGEGIGGQLIYTAHNKARELGFGAIVLLGHAGYYPRFGYQLAKTFGIKLPFQVPEENCMVIALTEDALQGVSGTVKYPEAFEVV